VCEKGVWEKGVCIASVCGERTVFENTNSYLAWVATLVAASVGLENGITYRDLEAAQVEGLEAAGDVDIEVRAVRLVGELGYDLVVQ
jgi:hypothetical protein